MHHYLLSLEVWGLMMNDYDTVTCFPSHLKMPLLSDGLGLRGRQHDFLFQDAGIGGSVNTLVYLSTSLSLQGQNRNDYICHNPGCKINDMTFDHLFTVFK